MENNKEIPAESAKPVKLEIGEISDGYHTFNELYDHRHALFIALCRIAADITSGDSVVWRTVKHHDGSSYPGYFLLGMFEGEGQQITYHLPLELWDKTHFAVTLECSPKFDGHTSRDVLKRLYKLRFMKVVLY